MDSISAFVMQIKKGDHFLSIDNVKGYRHFLLHTAMRDWFIFHWEGTLYQCVALPFGWGRSPLWFTQLMAVFMEQVRKLGYRTLAYLDDFLFAPSPFGIVSEVSHFKATIPHIGKVLKLLGLVRNKNKGDWIGSSRIEHLGVAIDSEAMRYYVCPRTAEVQDVREQTSPRCPRWALVGVEEGHLELLRSLCFPYYCDSLVQMLHKVPILGYLWEQDARCKRTCSSLPSKHPRPHQVERAFISRIIRETDGTISDCCRPRRCRRRGIWRHVQLQRSQSWDSRKLGVPGHLELEGQGTEHNVSGTESDSFYSHGHSWLPFGRGWSQEYTASCGQQGGCPYHELFCVCQSSVNERASLSEDYFGPLRYQNSVGMDSDSRQQVRGRSFATFPTRRLTDPKAIASFRDGWNEGSNRCLPISPRRRTFNDSAPASLLLALTRMGPATSSIALPTSEPDKNDADKLQETLPPAILVIPDWPRQIRHQTAFHMSGRVEVVEASAKEEWTARRRLNPKWRLLLLEINLE